MNRENINGLSQTRHLKMQILNFQESTFFFFFKSNHDEIDNTQQVGLACNKMINEKLTFYKWKQMSNKIYIIRYWCKIIKKYSPDQVLLNSEKKVKTDSLVLGSINDKSMSWLLFSKIYNSLFKNYQKQRRSESEASITRSCHCGRVAVTVLMEQTANTISFPQMIH